ncbi:hypothetical protein PVAP13_2KG300004 [Panicum virgatum]|uniref:Uncharacterized protein n=1 Tax=Panicum virgatum TaxID=38727 RepID=A0A8T0W6T1_PANVG|nr:hypothetical protein PVAP13_2KG300004 [Panicum virgatum]
MLILLRDCFFFSVTVTGVITIFVDFVLPTVGSGFKDSMFRLFLLREKKDMLTKRRC